MSTTNPQTPGTSGHNGQQTSIGSYLKYGMIAISLLNLGKKVFESPKNQINPLRSVEPDVDSNLSFSQRLSRHIINGALEKKGMKATDLKKTKQRVAYEQNLNLDPSENDLFLLHEPPLFNTTNITSTFYIDGSVPQEFEEEVPTKEFIAYGNSKLPPQLLAPAWGAEDNMDAEYFINTNLTFDREDYYLQKSDTWKGVIKNIDPKLPFALEQYFEYDLPENFDNGSLYLHLYLSKSDCDPDSELSHDVCELYGKQSIELSYHVPNVSEKKNKQAKDSESLEERERISMPDHVVYWNPDIRIYVGKPMGRVIKNSVSKSTMQLISLDESGKRDNTTGMVQRYFPPVLYNNFWHMKHEMTELNSTTGRLSGFLSIETPPVWKFQMTSYVLDFLKQQAQMGGMSNPRLGIFTIDSYKRIWLETNTWLLLTTVLVTTLHSLLEILAFKNDAIHWKNKKDQVGISMRSIAANVVMQTITLLYLMDNSEGTSSVVYISQGFGILLECWKITTVLKFQILQPSQQFLATENVNVRSFVLIGGRKLIVRDKRPLTDSEIKTREYDSKAFRALMWLFVPLMFGYSGYSLIYKKHSSWYSFTISTLVGFVYTYGFLIQLPSVYINYKLKSVAHLPKRAMAYKVVNTFIDDLFAFVIKMPLLHRLATLRDDVIFFIYLYQVWAYKVDYNRRNEYGSVSEAPDDETKKTQ